MKQRMKSIARCSTAVSLLILACSAPAQSIEQAGRPPMEEVRRQEMLKKFQEHTLTRLDNEIRILQTAQTCVRSAATPDALRNCHEQKREAMRQLMNAERALRDKFRAEHQRQPGNPNDRPNDRPHPRPPDDRPR